MKTPPKPCCGNNFKGRPCDCSDARKARYAEVTAPPKSWSEECETLTERIVIDYANFSGRESAHRAEFREAVKAHLDTAVIPLLTHARTEEREKFKERAIAAMPEEHLVPGKDCWRYKAGDPCESCAEMNGFNRARLAAIKAIENL